MSSALLGAAAAGIGAAAAAGTAPVLGTDSLGRRSLAAGAAGTVYKEDVNLGDVSNGLADDLGRLKDQFDKTLAILPTNRILQKKNFLMQSMML